jgi:uncharacterized protein (DUF849 family)
LNPLSDRTGCFLFSNTDLVGALERLVHVEELRPEICTLDCGTLNFGDGNLVYVSTPTQLRQGAKRIRELGVKPELEVFDTDHLWFVHASPGLRAAANCAVVSRITPSSIFGQRNSPSSSRLANRHTPVPSQ